MESHELVGASWDQLHGQHSEIIATFYDRFLTEHPQYKTFFPENMDVQMKHMVRAMTMVARIDGATETVEPQVERMGKAHTQYNLKEEDLHNFRDIFVSVVSEACGSDNWSGDHKAAWDDAFNSVLIPHMMQGMSA